MLFGSEKGFPKDPGAALQKAWCAIDHGEATCRFDPIRAGAYVNLGAVYNRMEQFDEAIQILRRSIQVDPKRAEGTVGKLASLLRFSINANQSSLVSLEQELKIVRD